MKTLISNPVNLIPLAVFVTKLLTINTKVDNAFVYKFIDWFSVIYAVLISLILLRVWTRRDEIEREFDREVDAIKNFFETLTDLPKKNMRNNREIINILHEYVLHVLQNFHYEIKTVDRIHNMKDNPITKGNDFLKKIREKCKDILNDHASNDREIFLGSEILQLLNVIVDIRGDRISLSSQKLFWNIRLIMLIISIVFLIPFHLLEFVPITSPVNILIIGITLLVIFIYLVIDDLDNLFEGTTRITIDEWKQLREYIDSHDNNIVEE